MNQIFPQIKIRTKDVSNIANARKLRSDLSKLGSDILTYAPSNFDAKKLDRTRIRIFKFPRNENCGEMFILTGRKRYVCINSSLINRKYYKSLEYALHGIAHSFCHLDDGAADEAFCEFVAYSIFTRFLNKKGMKRSKRITRKVMKDSTSEYNQYFIAAKKLEKTETGIMMKLNTQAKNRKISKIDQRKMFYKLLKFKKIKEDDCSNDIPELEKGFSKLR